MTGFDSKRQAAQDKMELADAYASAVAATPNMPTPLERKLAVERIERARNALEAALEQQAEPPPEWPLIKNILDEYGLDAIAFVAAWKAAQQQAEPVNQVSCFCHDGVSLQMVSGGAAPEGYLGKVTLLIDGEYVDYVKVQPEQQAEPVAYLCENAVGHKYFRWKKPSGTYKPIALYTTPPQRQWVGLEIEEVQDSYNSDYQAQTRAVEKLLKERNT